MWDLEVIRQQNEAAYLSSLQMINEGANSTAPAPKPEPVFPLAVLAAKLMVGPPSIVRIMDLLGNSDAVAQFLTLIREFTPDHEGEIMSEIEDGRRIHRFCQYFEYHYFPLEDPAEQYDGYLLEDFIDYIPVHLMGFSCDDYSEFMSYRAGFILLLAMVENPYVSYDDNERVPILEQVKKLVGSDLVELIPPDGWSPEDIHTMFDESPYSGVATFADWIHQCTGCMQMDANYAEYGPEVWSTRVVDQLTQEWPQVGEIQDKMFKIHEWLEEDMRQNFAKVLAVMHGRERIDEVYVAKEQMPFPLDKDGQVVRKEAVYGSA
ncbi:hypothetical protein LCGC14_1545230 [marine sediment metagenome]|uniref:Uncharacterized protein n=1 Tax=marine sediment metagenome TaxID=412755 RepID=A0A0F9JCR2_9ZZZZ